MRVGATLLLHRGMCVQSYGWSYFRPLGRLEHALSMLDEYQVDEVALIRPLRGSDSYQQIGDDLEKVQSALSLTPTCFGGGIRSASDLEGLASLPIERLLFNTACVRMDRSLIEAASEGFGGQALIALLPVRKGSGDRLEVYCSASSSYVPLRSKMIDFIQKWANEIVLHDATNEGFSDGFDEELLRRSPFPHDQTILSGGIGPSTSQWARQHGIAAVHVDNRILHAEFSIPLYRHG